MKLVASMFAASLIIAAGAANVYADTTEETTTTTTQTTTTAPSSIVLPAGVTYSVVDPSSGIIGVYDPNTRLINGRPLTSGWFVTEQTTGRVVATVDSNGNLIAMTTFPSALPQRFLVVDNRLVYFNNDYAFRRAQIETKMNAEYALGHLTNHQMDELREDLGRIASLEAKRKSDGTYSRSTVREIERRFAEANGDMNRYLANTGEKRAKIGIAPQ